MTPNELITALNAGPVAFETVMETLNAHYDFTPTAFRNGDLENSAEVNQGSCKILAFAQVHALSEQATLNAFGRFYTEDVLQHPEGADHQNIRNFMNTGWAGVSFDGQPLRVKSEV
ncbi:HopJ type III effector protein [Nitrincola nitratireducens]|uniref:HopJ type III effector protein n=1 Tax=Nitrincola nitratireducens TaxID=1229521 RepID=W9VAI9_9GAMM|nr:HopJ type III effector protein [Nitrincola nitratireducens]EXJ13072.1 HopJ type III effector protein [Nitrincola nitratireducens]